MTSPADEKSRVARKPGPGESIRKFCLECMGGKSLLVSECPDDACPLHEHRKDQAVEKPRRTPVRAIRCQCLICCAKDRKQIRLCPASPKTRPPFDPCLLWRFRLGFRPQAYERKKRKAQRTRLTLPGLS